MTSIPRRPPELRALLQRVADGAAALLEVGTAAIYLIRSGEHEARWTCDAGTDGEDVRCALRDWTFGVASGRIGEAITRGETIALGSKPPRAELPQWEQAPAAVPPRSAVIVPMLGSDGSPLGLLCLLDRDPRSFEPRELSLAGLLASDAAAIVELHRLIDPLAEAAAHYRFLLDRLPDGVWAADGNRIFTYVSGGCERLLGYRPDELVGRSSEIVMHESSREAFAAGYRWQMAHPDGEQTYRVNLRHRDGHPVPVELHNIGTSVDGRYGGGQGSVREMSERDRLEREIRAQAAELAASRERAHLAQELHDSVTQALFSITITAGAARILLEGDSPGIDEKLDELSSLARDGLAEMRSLIFELRPGNLAEEGFVPALRKHLAAVQGRTGLVIRLDVDPGLPRLGIATEDALYRIAQEAVHNVVKHAAAREVLIRITASPAGCRMEIQDDGVGFEPRARTDGLGLDGMAARAERLGGSLRVETSRGRGTLVCATVPLHPGDGDEESLA